MKILILDELCATCGYHRKYAIQLLRRFKRFTKQKREEAVPNPLFQLALIVIPLLAASSPSSTYQLYASGGSSLPPRSHFECKLELKQIWLAANLPCPKRLKAILPLWLPGYAQSFAPLSLPVIKALKRISPATIDRLLRPVRMEYRKHGRSTTKPGTLLRKQIPVKTNRWNETSPGFPEADTVAHCGDATAGMYVNTLDLVDIATGRTEQRAVRGRGEAGVLEQIRDVEHSLPLPLLGFDCDNGSEFLNYHLVRHFAERKAPVAFTRSRACHKNDNAHIEQKSFMYDSG